MRKLLLSLVVAGGALGLAAGPAGAATRAPATGSLTVVHGLPDLPVDVYVNHKVVASDVVFTNLATFKLPVGDALVELRAAGAKPKSRPALQREVGIKAGVSKSLVAHLNAAGTPRIDVYYDNTTKNRQQAQVTVRHDAAAPAVDVIVNDSLTLLDGLTNPGQGKAFVAAGTYDVKVAADADNRVVAFHGDVTLKPRVNTVVYALGDLADGSFSVVVQELAMT